VGIKLNTHFRATGDTYQVEMRTARVVGVSAWCIRTGRHTGVAPRRPTDPRPRTRPQTGLLRRVRAAADGPGSGVGGGNGGRGESKYSQSEWDAALRMCAELLQVWLVRLGCVAPREGGVRCDARAVTSTWALASMLNEGRCVAGGQEATAQANEDTRKELLAAYKTEAIDSLNNGASPPVNTCQDSSTPSLSYSDVVHAPDFP
jgi:hypothetical protein